MSQGLLRTLSSSVSRYLFAVAAVALLLRLVIVRQVGEIPTYVTFYPVVFTVALLAGLGPGLLATALSGLAAMYWAIPPVGSFRIIRVADAVGLSIFSLTSIAVSIVLELYRRSRTRAADYEMELAQRRSEAALRVSESKLEGIIGSAMDAIISVDEDQKVLLFNRAAEEMFGCPRAEALGTDAGRFIPARFREAHGRHMRVYSETGATTRSMRSLGLLRGLRCNGEEFPIEATISQVEVAGQKMFTVILRDVTRRVQDEEALRASESRWATTLRSIGDAVISTNADGVVEFMNPVAEHLTGWPSSEAPGRRLDEILSLVHETSREPLESSVLQVKSSGQTLNLAENALLIRRDGAEFPIQAGASPIRDEKGALSGVVIVFHDTLEQRRMAQSLRNSERLATTGRLAASIAHEIHNPLDMVGNLLHLIHLKTDSADLQEYTNLAAQELERVTQMTKHMLAFQREAATPVAVRMDDILNSVVALFERKLHTALIHLESRIECGGELLGLPGELRQVFANLVGNAIEAMNQGGTITLHAYEAREWRHGHRGVRVNVVDNGPGIPAALRPRIFEPFFTTKGESGTGLGLWIAQGIIEKHGGSLRVKTRTGQGSSGTCFSVFLPLANARGAGGLGRGMAVSVSRG